MVTIAGIPISRFQQAAKLWEGFRKDENVDWDTQGSLKFEVAAVALAEGYLLRKNIGAIDLDDAEHRRYLEIAANLDRGFRFSNQEDARIALAMKDIRFVSHENVAAPFRKVGDVVAPIVDAMGIVSGPEVKLGILFAKWGLNQAIKVPEAITLKELEEAFPEGIPLEEAQKFLGMSLEKEAQAFVLQNVVADLQMQKNVMGEVEKDSYPAIGLSMATQCAQIVLTYYQLDAANRGYERERANLCKKFTQICESLKLETTMDFFRHKNTDEIVGFFQRQQTSDTFGKQAKLIFEITERVCKERDALLDEIRNCVKNKGFYEKKGGQFQRVNRRLQNFYNYELKSYQEEIKVLGYIKLGSSLCDLIALIPSPDAIVVAALGKGIGMAADIGMAHQSAKRQSCLDKCNEALEKAEKGAQLLGYLSNQNLAELRLLKQTKREELDFLIVNKDHIAPSVYRNLLEELEIWLETERKAQEKGIEKQKEELKKLSIEPKEQKKGAGSKHRKIESCASLGIKEAEKKQLGDAIAKSEKALEETKELQGIVDKEKADAEYFAPITSRIEALMKAEVEKLPPEKEQQWNEKVGQLFKALKSIREEGYTERQVIYNSFVPIASGLQFFSEEWKWLGDSCVGSVLRNAPGFLKLARDVDSFRNNVLAVEEFSVEFQKLREKYEQIDPSLFKKLSSKLMFDQLIPPLLGAVGLGLSIASTLYRIVNPAKNPIIEAFGKMFDQGMRYQAELLEKHLEILTRQNEDLSADLKSYTNQIIERIEFGNRRVVKGINDVKFTAFESNIDVIKNKVELKINFEKIARQLVIYLTQAKEDGQNGLRDLEGYEGNFARVVMHPAYYTGWLYGAQGKGLASFHLLRVFLDKATQLRKSQTAWSLEAKQALLQFIELALKEIEKYQELIVFPEKQLKAALEAKSALLEGINRRSMLTKNRQTHFAVDKLEKTRASLETHQKSLGSRVGWNKFYLSKVVCDRSYYLVQNSKEERLDWDSGGRHERQDVIATFSLGNAARGMRFSEAAFSGYSYTFSIFDHSPDFRSTSHSFATSGGRIFSKEVERVVETSSLNKTKEVAGKVFLNFTIKVDYANYVYEVTTAANSYVSAKDMQNISGFYPSDEADYNGKIGKMVDWLIETIKDPKFDKENMQILPSKTNSLIPLVFPKKTLLNSIVKCLESDAYKFASLEMGIFTLGSYDFYYVEKEGKFELTIQFYIEPREGEGKTRHYCDCVVAEFDSKTVDAFRICKSTIQEKKALLVVPYERRTDFDLVTEPCYNEFLIQAMYSGRHGLGLPGKGTYRMESGEIVSPVERQFPGLYLLFDAFPNTLKSYDSGKNEAKALCDPKDFQENLDVSKYKENPDFNSIPFRIRWNQENYIGTSNEMAVQLSALQETKEYRNYLREHQTFQALYRLGNECNENMLVQAMAQNLGLISPTELETILAQAELLGEASLPPQVNAFNARCNLGVSATRLALSSSQKELVEWKSELHSS